MKCLYKSKKIKNKLNFRDTYLNKHLSCLVFWSICLQTQRFRDRWRHLRDTWIKHNNWANFFICLHFSRLETFQEETDGITPLARYQKAHFNHLRSVSSSAYARSFDVAYLSFPVSQKVETVLEVR